MPGHQQRQSRGHAEHPVVQRRPAAALIGPRRGHPGCASRESREPRYVPVRGATTRRRYVPGHRRAATGW